jgi:hypothetical protein
LRQALLYLDCFAQGTKHCPATRPGDRAQCLRDLVDEGTVHWLGGETRPCAADIWARRWRHAGHRAKGLKNHNYLRHVAWELAAETAAARNAAGETSARRAPPEDEESAREAGIGEGEIEKTEKDVALVNGERRTI